MTRFLLIFALFLLAGCSSQKVPVAVEPTILLWSAKTIPMSSAEAWAREAEKRLHTKDFVLVMCHGGPMTIHDPNGKTHDVWYCYPDSPRKPMPVDDIAWVLRNEHWNKPLVFISCNAGGFKLTAPNTLYGRKIIWADPDSATPLWQFRDRALIGRIEDFDSTSVPLAGER